MNADMLKASGLERFKPQNPEDNVKLVYSKANTSVHKKTPTHAGSPKKICFVDMTGHPMLMMYLGHMQLKNLERPIPEHLDRPLLEWSLAYPGKENPNPDDYNDSLKLRNGFGWYGF